MLRLSFDSQELFTKEEGRNNNNSVDLTDILFLFSSKNHSSCTSFMQTGTWNLSNYSECFLKIFPAFQNIEAAFERCSTKVFHQNDVMKYNASAPVVKSGKTLHGNLLKITLHHRYFSKNFSASSEQRY